MNTLTVRCCIIICELSNYKLKGSYFLRLHTRKMKHLSLLLAVPLILVACSNEDDSVEEAAIEEKEVEASEEEAVEEESETTETETADDVEEEPEAEGELVEVYGGNMIDVVDTESKTEYLQAPDELNTDYEKYKTEEYNVFTEDDVRENMPYYIEFILTMSSEGKEITGSYEYGKPEDYTISTFNDNGDGTYSVVVSGNIYIPDSRNEVTARLTYAPATFEYTIDFSEELADEGSDMGERIGYVNQVIVNDTILYER